MSIWNAQLTLQLLQAVAEKRSGSSVQDSIPGLDQAPNELINRLFEKSSFWKPPKKSFRMMEFDLKATQDASVEQKLKPYLSTLLMVDAEEAMQLWSTLSDLHHMLGDQKIHIDVLIKVRNEYFEQRNDTWTLLEELLKIDLDVDHCYYEPAKKVVDQLLHANLVDKLLLHLKKMSVWYPSSFDSDFDSDVFGTADIHDAFVTQHLCVWMNEYTEEVSKLLDVFILLAYSRVNFTATQLETLLEVLSCEGFKRYSSIFSNIVTALSTTELYKIRKTIEWINFKTVLLIGELFQFWRFFSTEEEEQEVEKTAFDLSLTSATLDNINRLLISANSSNTTTCLINVHTSKLVLYLWRCYLTYVGNDEQLLDKVRNQQLADVVAGEGLSEQLLQIATASMGLPKSSFRAAEDDSINIPHLFLYCAVLQEVVNVFISQRTLQDNGANLLDIDTVTLLVQLAYRHRADYCQAFLSAWQNAETHNSYPLIQLIHILSEDTMHAPAYFFSIASTLCTSTLMQKEIIPLLDQLIHVTSMVDFEDIRIAAPNNLLASPSNSAGNSAFFSDDGSHLQESFERLRWLSVKDWISQYGNLVVEGRNCQVQYCKERDFDLSAPQHRGGLFAASGKEAPFSINVYNHGSSKQLESLTRGSKMTKKETLSVCCPEMGNNGSLLDVLVEQNRAVVKWDIRCDWWSIIMDYFINIDFFSMQYQSPDQSHENELTNYAETMRGSFSLMQSMLEQGGYKLYFHYRLAEQFNKIALLQFLRHISCASLYPILIESFPNLKCCDLFREEKLAEELVQDLSIEEELSRTFLTAVQAYKQDSQVFFTKSFVEFTAAKLVQVFLYDVRHFEALQQPSTSMLFVNKTVREEKQDKDRLQQLFVKRIISTLNCMQSFALDNVDMSLALVQELCLRFHSSGESAAISLFQSLMSIGKSCGTSCYTLHSSIFQFLQHLLPNLSTAKDLLCSTILPQVQLTSTGVDNEHLMLSLRDMESFLVSMMHYISEIAIQYASPECFYSIDAESFVDYLISLKDVLLLIEKVLVFCQAEKSRVSLLDHLITHSQFIETLIQFASALASLECMQGELKEVKTDTKTFKSLLEATYMFERRSKSSALPMSHKLLMESSDWSFLQKTIPWLIDVSSTAVSILHALTSWQVTEQRLQDVFVQLLIMPVATLSSYNFVLNRRSTNTTTLATTTNVACSHFTALFGLMDVSLGVRWIKHFKQFRKDLIPFCCEMLAMLGRKASISFLDIFGNINIGGLQKLLVQQLSSEYISIEEKAGLWKFLSVLAEYHPNILSMFFSQSMKREEDLLQLVYKQLAEVENSLQDNISNFYYLFMLCLQLLEHAKYYPLLSAAAFQLVEKSKFWDYIIFPLKECNLNKPSADLLKLVEDNSEMMGESKDGHVASARMSHEDISTFCQTHATDDLRQDSTSMQDIRHIMLQLQPELHSSHHSTLYQNAHKYTTKYCEQARLIALVLRILTIERYGLFFELDDNVGQKARDIAKKLNDVYIQMNVQSRFNGWIRQFLQLERMDCLHDDELQNIRQLSAEVGIVWEQLYFDELSSPILHWKKSIYLSNLDDKTGFASILPANRMESIILLSKASLLHVNFEVPLHTMATMRVLKNLHNAFVQVNASVMLSSAELLLLQAWKEFLHLFVVPRIDIHRIASMSSSTSASSSAVGSMSPLSNPAADSPVSRRESAFSGDKRSYEIVSEILKSIISDGNESRDLWVFRKQCSVAFSCELLEKSSLLMNMLHHQMKTIAFRASNPEQSVVQDRDTIGSMRLTPEKLKEILNKLLQIFNFFLWPTPPSTVNQTNSNNYIDLLLLPNRELQESMMLKIQSRFITMMLMILGYFQRAEEICDAHLLPLFSIALQLLQSLYQKYGIALFTTASSSSSSSPTDAKMQYCGVKFTELQALAKQCLQLIQQSLILASSPSTAAHLQMLKFRGEIEQTKFLPFLLQIIDSLHVVAADSIVNTSSSFEQVWETLMQKQSEEGVLDMTTELLSPANAIFPSSQKKNFALPNKAALPQALITSYSILQQSLVVSNMDEEMLRQLVFNLGNAAVFKNLSNVVRNMYHRLKSVSNDGEQVMIYYEMLYFLDCNQNIIDAWTHSLQIIESILLSIKEKTGLQHFDQDNIIASSALGRFKTTVQELICYYEELIVGVLMVLNLNIIESVTFTSSALRYMTYAWHFVVVVMEAFPSTNKLSSFLEDKSLLLLSKFSSMLSLGEQDFARGLIIFQLDEAAELKASSSASENESLIVVRKEQGIEEVKAEDLRKHVGFGHDHTLSFNKDDEPSKILFGNNTLQTPKSILKGAGFLEKSVEKTPTRAKVQKSNWVFQSKFLNRVVQEVHKLVLTTSIFLRYITPPPFNQSEEFDVDGDMSSHNFTVGDRVFYRSNIMHIVCQATVHRVHHNGELDVKIVDPEGDTMRSNVLLHGAVVGDAKNIDSLIERNIDPKLIKFCNPPLVTFVSDRQRHEGAWLGLLNTSELFVILDHSMNLLRHHAADKATLNLLFQQVLYLFTYNMDHISLAPVQENIDSMIKSLQDSIGLIEAHAYNHEGSDLSTQTPTTTSAYGFHEYMTEWTKEIICRLEIEKGLVIYTKTEHVPTTPGERNHKRSPSLRDKDRRFDYYDETD